MNENTTKMPIQRLFLSNFLAAFRTHNALQQSKAPSATTPSTHATHPLTQSTSVTVQASTPRTISTSSKPGATTTATAAAAAAASALPTFHTPRTRPASPLSASPGAQVPSTQPPLQEQQRGRYIASPRGRRGSDSSSEGFRDVLGAEKWYIGGRTAAGEEKYFKLGVVRRRRSGGSLSLDRLSL